MKKILILTLKIAFIAFIFHFLFRNNLLELPVLLNMTKKPDIMLLVIIQVIIIILIGNVKWFLLLKSQKVDITFLAALRLYYIGYSFNYFLPGAITGDVIKISYFANSSKKYIIGSSVLIDRILSLVSIIFIGLLFLPKVVDVRYNMMLDVYPLNIIYYAIIVLIFIVLFGLVNFSINNKILYKKIIKLTNKKHRIFKFTSSVIKSFFAYRKIRLTMVINIIIASIVQIIMAFCLVILGQELININNLGIVSYNLANIFAQLTSILPISPGGIGIGEVAFSKILFYLNNKIILGYASIYFAFRILNIVIGLPAIGLFMTNKKYHVVL